MRPDWWPEHMNAGEFTYAPGATCGPRVQRDYQIQAFETGSAVLRLNDRVYHVRAGQAVLLHPGGQEFFCYTTSEPTRHTWVVTHYKGVPPCVASASVDFELHIIPLSPTLDAWIELARRYPTGTLPLADDPAALAAAYGAIACFAQEAGITPTRRATRVHPSVSKVYEHIRRFFTNPMDLRDLAALAQMSPEHLCRLFHAFLPQV